MARSDLLTRQRSTRPLRRPDTVPGVLIGVLVAILLVVAGLSLHLPAHHDVTVENPLAYQASVRVRAADDSAWTGLGSVGRESSVAFLQAPDQGDRWVFEFGYAGETVQVEVDRARLEADGWTVTVPDGLGEELADADVPAASPEPTAPADAP